MLPLSPVVIETADKLQALVDRYGPVTKVNTRGLHTWLDFRWSLDSHPLPWIMHPLIIETVLSLYPECEIVR